MEGGEEEIINRDKKYKARSNRSQHHSSSKSKWSKILKSQRELRKNTIKNEEMNNNKRRKDQDQKRTYT